MNFILSHTSALNYWRSFRSGISKKKVSPSNMRLPNSVQTIKDLSSLDNLNIPLPLDILVGNSGTRITSPVLRNHIDCHTYPNGSFYKIERGLFVSSPELCFLQIASQIELLKLIELGFELCGSYRQNGIDNEVVANNVDIINDQRPGFRIDKQLTTVRRLRAYISKMERIRGIKKASRAARYLIDHSASPAETMLTMMLALPYMLGGFKLPTPSLNARI